MKEWLALDTPSDKTWSEIVDEALAFVRSKK